MFLPFPVIYIVDGIVVVFLGGMLIPFPEKWLVDGIVKKTQNAA